MSITPLTPALPASFADAAAGEPAPTAGGFAALVAGLLAGTPDAGAPLPAPAAAVASGTGAAPDAVVDPAHVVAVKGEPAGLVDAPAAIEESTGDESIVAPEGGADPGLVLTTGVIPGLPIAWQPPVAPVPVVDAPGAGGEAVDPLAGVTDSGSAPAPGAGAAEQTGADDAPTSGPGSAPQAAVPPTTSPVPDPVQQPAAQATAPVASAPPVAVTPPTTAPGVTPTVAPSMTPTAPTAPADPSAAARPAPAVAQVVPEVTRLVSRGNGVHRLTMRLQPEALGEVRVTLTVRDGAVQVRLTGGDEAARALAEGAPELRRVLEAAGASEARVVVRDLAGQPAATQTATQTGSSTGAQTGATDLSYDARSGAGGDSPSTGGDAGQQGQHARTRGGAGARDGLTDGATALRPDPVTAARQGIDLTM